MSRIELNNLGIPPLAGICTYEEACRPGCNVDDNVAMLKRFHYVKKRLNETFAAHIARTPEWEIKCGISLHLWLEAEHVASIRKRISEMREPPLHLDKVPDDRLKALCDELIRAGDTLELLVGIYRVVKPDMVRSLNKHLAETNALADQPTCRMLRFMLLEETEMLSWGEQAIVGLLEASGHSAELSERCESWRRHLQLYLEQAGGIYDDLPGKGGTALPAPRSDGGEYEMDAAPRRDGRLQDPFNGAVPIDSFYRDDSLPMDERIYALLYKRLREMDVPEWMGPIIYKTKGKPWEYYADMSRQLWDEARHAMMGEVGLYRDGVPFYAYPVSMMASYALNTACEPVEAHAVLYGIEQGLMKKETGKWLELDIASSSGDRLAALFQDYDWADEMLHAQIGRKWLTPEYGDHQQMRDEMSRAFAKWAENIGRLKGNSDQHNWWPEFIEEARKSRAAGK